MDDVAAVGLLGADHRQDGLEVVDLGSTDDLLGAAHFGGHGMSPWMLGVVGCGRWFGAVGCSNGGDVDRSGPAAGRRASGDRCPGKHEGLHQVGGPCRRRCRSIVGRRGDGVGEHDAGGPLRHPAGLGRAHPSGQERRGEAGRGGQQAVGLVEGQMAEDHLGLVLDQVGQRLMVAYPGRRLDDAADQGLGQVAGLAQPDPEGREQPGHLGVDHRGQHLVPAPREHPVDGGPRHTGLPGRCRPRWSWPCRGGPGRSRWRR